MTIVVVTASSNNRTLTEKNSLKICLGPV